MNELISMVTGFEALLCISMIREVYMKTGIANKMSIFNVFQNEVIGYGCLLYYCNPGHNC